MKPWGSWEPAIMDTALFALIAEKNSADLEAIITKIGLPTLFAIMPNVIAIMKTVQSQPKGVSK
jgi:hypothetical protein